MNVNAKFEISYTNMQIFKLHRAWSSIVLAAALRWCLERKRIKYESCGKLKAWIVAGWPG